MLASLSKTVMDTFFQPHKSDFTNPEWNRMVKRAFGETLVSQTDDMSIETDAEVVLNLVKKKLNDWIDEIQEHEYVFGCHLCNISDFEPLSIGYVQLEPRLVWLARMYERGNISRVSLSRIRRSWRGDRLRARKAFQDEIYEKKILDAIGKSHFVCSVTVLKTGSDAGLQKALTAARLAMTVIALAWERPSSALSSMTLIYDRQPHPQHSLFVLPDRSYGWKSSRSYTPGGVRGLSEEQWAELRADLDETSACTGEVITCVTHGRENVSRPKLLSVLYQALFWFHEGCREQVDTMAIVKFCSALEALTWGRKKKGILGLVKSHLVVKDEAKLHKEIEKIYGEGRSRTVHGTNDKLGHDWSNSRAYMETLARLCLKSCLELATKYKELDDPRCFSRLRK